MFLYMIAGWVVSGLLLWVTGGAKAAARKMGNPGSWECATWGGALGLAVLVAASYPWKT